MQLYRGACTPLVSSRAPPPALTFGEQVGEVGLRGAELRVPVAVVAREEVLLVREPPFLVQAVVLLQEP